MTRPLTSLAIIAHGQPGDPGPMQAWTERLAAQVAALLPGWQVIGATLACEDSLRRLGGAGSGEVGPGGVGLVYPLFMAKGWFTQTEMPRRLRAVGAEGFAMMRPLGLDPGLPAIGARLAREAAAGAGFAPQTARLVVAGHGSGKSRASAEATRAFAAAVAPLAGFVAVDCGFIEEAPFLHDLRPAAPAVCLPFFASPASHTAEDIPEAWATAGNPGPITPPVGTAPEVPALIAAAARAAAR